jgi:hypothetical protein
VYNELHTHPTRCASPTALHNLISTARRPLHSSAPFALCALCALCLFRPCQHFPLLRQPPLELRGDRPVKELKGLVEAELALDAGVDHVAVGVGVQGQLPLLHLLEQGQGLRNKPVAGVTGQHLQGGGRSENDGVQGRGAENRG